MQDFYAQLTAVLGKAQEDPGFRDFVADLAEQPVVDEREGLETQPGERTCVHQGLRHAHNGRRIEPAAQRGAHGGVAAESDAHGLAEELEKVLAVLLVGGVADNPTYHWVPVTVLALLPVPQR